MSGHNRAQAAVLGSFVADAATTGLHWIYDQAKVADLAAAAVKAGRPIAFHDPPSCPFYKSQVGDSSPWAHELIPLLRTAAAKHAFDADAYAAACKQYHVDEKDSIPYTNSALRSAFTAMDAGKSWREAATDDTQAHSMGKAPILVALYAGKPELESMAREACAVHQSSDTAADFGVAAAKILEQIVLGKSIKEALQWAEQAGSLPEAARQAVQLAKAKENDGYAPAVKEMGASCALPGVFSGAVLALYKAEQGTSYKQIIEDNMLAGGDNCSRAGYIGACVAAEQGADCIPQEWKDKTKFYAEASQLVQQL